MDGWYCAEQTETLMIDRNDKDKGEMPSMGSGDIG